MSLLVDIHNEVRESRGLSPLVVDDQLNQAAQDHAEFMLERRKLTHIGRGRSQVGDRLSDAGYRAIAYAENVAAGQTDERSVMASWIRSRPHHRNMLGNYTAIGTGRAGNFWCVVFARPLAVGG